MIWPFLKDFVEVKEAINNAFKKILQLKIGMIVIAKYNQATTIKVATYICIALILLIATVTFSQYYSMKLNLINPLIPKDLVQKLVKPYLIKGIILLSGLAIIIVSTFYKQNLIALVLAILLITYYIFSNHYIGNWNTQIS